VFLLEVDFSFLQKEKRRKRKGKREKKRKEKREKIIEIKSPMQ
jgi:hypothetical protein